MIDSWLIQFYDRFRPYHTRMVVLLILAAVVNFSYELPVYVWAVFLLFFFPMLIGSMMKQRRESQYA